MVTLEPLAYAPQQPYHKDGEETRHKGEVTCPSQSGELGLFKQQMPRPGFLLQGKIQYLSLLKRRWCQEAVLEPEDTRLLLPLACHPVPKGISLWAQFLI